MNDYELIFTLFWLKKKGKIILGSQDENSSIAFMYMQEINGKQCSHEQIVQWKTQLQEVIHPTASTNNPKPSILARCVSATRAVSQLRWSSIANGSLQISSHRWNGTLRNPAELPPEKETSKAGHGTPISF